RRARRTRRTARCCWRETGPGGSANPTKPRRWRACASPRAGPGRRASSSARIIVVDVELVLDADLLAAETGRVLQQQFALLLQQLRPVILLDLLLHRAGRGSRQRQVRIEGGLRPGRRRGDQQAKPKQ